MAIWTALTLVRYTVPRVRIDQMMAFNWKFLVPISMVNIFVVMVLAKVFVADPALVAANGGILVAPAVQALIVFLSNVAVLLVALSLVARRARVLRLIEAEDLEKRREQNMMAATAH
jgi:hypothetical protein